MLWISHVCDDCRKKKEESDVTLHDTLLENMNEGGRVEEMDSSERREERMDRPIDESQRSESHSSEDGRNGGGNNSSNI